MRNEQTSKTGRAGSARVGRTKRMPGRGSRVATVPVLPEVRMGLLSGFDAAGAPLVEFEHGARDHVVAARATVELRPSHVGQGVALVFERGDASLPIVIGVLQTSAPPGVDSVERLVLTAGREILLRSGKSSITLHHDGRVVIQGEYLVSRSNGVNRIKGGSVQIN